VPAPDPSQGDGGVSSFYTGIFQGAVMILAVLLASLSARIAQHGDRSA